MLAGPERVRADVRTRAIGVARFAPARRDAVRLAGDRVAHGVSGPRLFRFRRLDDHSLCAPPRPPLLNGLFDKFLYTQALDRNALARGRRKAQSHLFVENERESRPD